MTSFFLNRKKVIILAGSTGSGKTELVQNLDPNKFEIISFDSRQIYKEIAIGVAKPTAQQLHKIKHHLISHFEPDFNFTVADYCNLAEKSLNGILKRNKIPILTVGTAFYLKAFLFGSFNNKPAQQEIKKRLMNLDIKLKYKILQKTDPDYLSKISQNDKYRLHRALEMILYGLKPSTLSPTNGLLEKEIDIRGFFLDIERNLLYQKINKRAQEMLKNGMIEETEIILKKYGKDCSVLKSIGYNYIIDYLEEKITFNQLFESLAQAHRNYAKKQITWFRNTFGFLLEKLSKKQIIEQIRQYY